MRRILVVDDAPDVQKLVEATLGNSYLLTFASNIADAWRLATDGSFDLILLDVVLPDGDGYQLCTRLQNSKATSGVAVIFLTGKGDLTDRVMGFSIGADDYIVKPVEPVELRARVDARLRKLQQRSEQNESLRKEDLRIDFGTQKAYVCENGVEKQLDLTPAEFKLLQYFARHEDHVFSREQLLSSVWSDNVNVHDRSVDVHVSNLRRKLKVSVFTISPVYGVGYRFAKRASSETRQNKKAA